MDGDNNTTWIKRKTGLTKKELLINSIEQRYVDKIPMMYRADPIINEKMIEHFGLGSIEDGWEKLIDRLGADNFSDGETLGSFTNYFPKYIGPGIDTVYEINHFFVWGIKPVKIDAGGTTDIVFNKNPPLYDLGNISDISNYKFPEIGWFDFDIYKVITEAKFQDFGQQEEIKAGDLKRSDEYFLNTTCMNNIFMTSVFMRGLDRMLEDLVSNKKYAHKLIGNIGEFILEFCSKNLAAIGNVIDLYGIWDDFAMQDGLMISADTWREFYKPWNKKLIELVKKYDLYVCFHICGSCVDIIGDLIEIGVDILDPVQVSARNMEIGSLKKLFGDDICFHGGIDAQRLIPLGKPDDIRKEVDRVKRLFGHDGGIILGPSHYLTADTPLENIIAIYK